MNSEAETAKAKSYWFVGSLHGQGEDQLDRFVAEGVWENPYEDKYLDVFKSIKPGDRIAVRTVYTRKHDLPFDNRGHTVSVMKIRATGTVTENPGDGQTVKVRWTLLDPPKEWYFYTHIKKVWRVIRDSWFSEGLIDFTFNDKPQDLERFRNHPFWRERFGDIPADKRQFEWTRFYEAFADRLLQFKEERAPLIANLHKIAAQIEVPTQLNDKFADGTMGPLRDICPFTVFGVFNRGITDTHRKIIAAELAKILKVAVPVPETFEGIPVLNNMKSWFFGFEKDREPDDIDKLWEIFAKAVEFAESEDPEARTAFIRAYDEATKVCHVGWNLTMGLYWIRPWNYITLDSQSRVYITKKLDIEIGHNGPGGYCSANDYLAILETLETRFQEDNYPVHSFPELSYTAWLYKDNRSVTPPVAAEEKGDESGTPDEEETMFLPPIQPYSLDDIMDDGCFHERSRLERMLNKLRTKKNLILQGPPGTGKTWLAKRLAFALMGQKDESRLRAIQFHPHLSYEDFVRGWRPAGDGRLALIDGPFMEMVGSAKGQPEKKHVFVIEEINRGNPAQIFGEMLTLLEADKRTPSEALELCYKKSDEERVHIPDNLYVIGTMNIADRSLALVDLALRRRFAFVDLEPAFGEVWRRWVHEQCGIDMAALSEIERRVRTLNEEISSDASLGTQFRIGHSYLTPPFKTRIDDPWEWFREVVNTEIGPLLDEYWFDALEKARDARNRMVKGL